MDHEATRILLAEADVTARAFLTDNLTADGYTIAPVATDQAALAELAHGQSAADLDLMSALPKKRADAQRNTEARLHAAMTVFARDGVDAGVRQIAEQAGVGVGTVYRHFPQRSDLITAAFRREVDARAKAAVTLAAEYPPSKALAHWMQRFVDFHPGAARGSLPAAVGSGSVDCGRSRTRVRGPTPMSAVQRAVALADAVVRLPSRHEPCNERR